MKLNDRVPVASEVVGEGRPAMAGPGRWPSRRRHNPRLSP
ncbi:hypothetical protein GJR88_04881 [Dietzia sp. DQ12-45-1b]|nr:hypothetical protein GJR88_04881 [Dietzia sp. DQ12-45-1b]